MPENQKDIYYMTGQDKNIMNSSSFVTGVRDKGFEVLLMDESIDEYVLQQVNEYDGHKLVSITKEGLELPKTDEEKKNLEALQTEYQDVCQKIQEILKNQVEKVYVPID